MRTLALDIGERRIGVALSDPQGILASPLTVLTRAELRADVEAILNLVRQYEVDHIVVGLPRSLDGSLGHQAKQVQAFVHKLSQHTEVSIDTWDERLSTVAAEKMLKEVGGKRAKGGKQVDAAAAALILQSYLDRMRSLNE